MATIRKYTAKTGAVTWQVRIRKQGKLLNGSFPQKKLAEDWARKTETEIVQETYSLSPPKPVSHTVGELIDLYVERLLPLKAEKTIKNDRTILAWWKENLGDTYLQNVKAPILEDYKHLLLRKPLAPGTVNRYLNVLSPVFSYAASPRLAWITSNPFNHVPRLKETARLPLVSDEQLNNLLFWCGEFGKPWLYLYVRLALGTGGRYREILRLTWKQVNWKKHTITFTNTKGKEDRAVPVDTDTLDLLRQHYDTVVTDENWGLIDAPNTKIFPIKGIVHPWYKAREKAGLSWLHRHDLRHIFASRMAEKANADLGTLAQLLGHKTLRVTMRYRNLMTHHYEGMVNTMAEKVFGKKA